MSYYHLIRRVAGAIVCLQLFISAGCGPSQTSPALTPEAQKEMTKKYVSEELKTVIELEKKHGIDHSQVRQMKIELGLDPDRPAAELEQ